MNLYARTIEAWNNVKGTGTLEHLTAIELEKELATKMKNSIELYNSGMLSPSEFIKDIIFISKVV